MIYRLIIKYRDEAYQWDFDNWDDRQKVLADTDDLGIPWETMELIE